VNAIQNTIISIEHYSKYYTTHPITNINPNPKPHGCTHCQYGSVTITIINE